MHKLNLHDHATFVKSSCTKAESKWKTLLTSRKFWAALVGLVMVLVKAWKPDFPLSEDQIVSLAAVLAAYILGTALEDSGRARQASSSRE